MCSKKNEKNVRQSQQRRSGGGVLVEFALILPVLVILFSGILEYGAALREAKLINEVARVSVRTVASVRGSDDVLRNSVQALFNTMITQAGKDPARYSLATSVQRMNGSWGITAASHGLVQILTLEVHCPDTAMFTVLRHLGFSADSKVSFIIEPRISLGGGGAVA